MASVQQSFVESAMGGSANDSAQPAGLLAVAFADMQQSSTKYVVAGVLIAAALLLHKVSNPSMDTKEPPILHPRIPILGHFLGMVKNQSAYFNNLYKKHRLPIATLPIFGGKTYAVWDPDLVASALRKKTLSFDPLAVDAAQVFLGMTTKQFEPFRGTPTRPSLLPEFYEALHHPMRGEALHSMNASALNYVSNSLHSLVIGNKTVEISNAYLWIRDLITLATSTALLGDHNPLNKDYKLLEDMWTFEAAIPTMLAVPAHSISLPKAYKAREALQAAMKTYYESKHDLHESSAAVTKARSAVLRKHKLPDSDIGRFEVSLFQLATGNTVPTAYWMLLNIWSRPELVERLRAEITPLLVRGENDQVTFDITKMEEQCPLLVSCYRESNRLSNHILCVRKVLEDCTISDSKGNSYLLKKDCVMQVPAAYTHRSEDVWGKDAAEYNPDRFIPTQTKLQRSAYMPFGGGKHLCPGRNFAFAEIMGFVAALVVGFDGLPAEGENAPWKLPREAPSTIFGGVLKPENGGEGFGVQIRRAKGWENAKWKFVC